MPYYIKSEDKFEDPDTQEPIKCLVFCNSKKIIDKLVDTFKGYYIPSEALHGDKSQWDREHNLRKFRDGECTCLFATDVASRGIDVKGVTHVVNYDPAGDDESHIHRIGRTGRAGKKGKAYNFVVDGSAGGWDDDRWSLRIIVESMKKAGQKLEGELLTKAREAAIAGVYNKKSDYTKKYSADNAGGSGGSHADSRNY